MKWNMGWMHDTLNYFSKDPVYRKFHQNDLTFAFWYAFFENFLLPLSHDEVVYGKKSLLEKMPGDSWQQFANLRLLLGYMYSFPGKKLLFMGIEFAQRKEWNHESFLEWSELEHEPHRGIQRLVADLNRIYSKEAALYTSDFQPKNFEWIDAGDARQSVIIFLRKTVLARDEPSVKNTFYTQAQSVAQQSINKSPGRQTDTGADGKSTDNPGKDESIKQNVNGHCVNGENQDGNNDNSGRNIESDIVIVCNFTPTPRYKYRIGVPQDGEWIEIFNSDAQAYGGSGHGNFGKIDASKKSTHGRPYTISVTLPPLAVLYFKKNIVC
jgi:1,4-alpha-glucan branching enzyme